MADLSFLRLKPTFAEAVQVDDFTDLDVRYSDTIRLSPNESYVQITNFTEGFSFNGNYAVYLIDGCQNDLADITENVAIEEFTDDRGERQFSFEISNVGLDYYNNAVYLKFVHTVSDSVLYSNPFVLTDYKIENTVRFDYKGYGKFEGIDYSRALVYQSVRLLTSFVGYVDETETKNYYQMSTNNTISSRSMIKRGAKYKVNRLDAFSLFRYNLLLNHDVIYLNGKRVTNKTILKNGDQLGNSNITNADFSVYTNESDTYTPTLQIFEELALVTVEPFNTLTQQV